MPKCRACSNNAGLFELQNGMCLPCQAKERQREQSRSYAIADAESAAERRTRDSKALTDASKPSDFEDISENVVDEFAARIILTTTHTVPRHDIDIVIGVISSEVAMGMNIFKDILMSLTDVFGGRSKTLQSTLKEAKDLCFRDLRREALKNGADAVVGIDLDYSEFASGNKGGMLFVVASGTAVKFRKA